MKNGNIMIVGVGGQGSLFAVRVLGHMLMSRGHDVKVSEVHGMSQRGGSVVTYVKYGEAVDSPVICRGEADVIIAFEQLEGARWIDYLRPDGTLIINTQKINPLPVIAGAASYPEHLSEDIKKLGIRCVEVDATTAARLAGNEKAVNIVLLGVWAAYTGADFEEIKKAIVLLSPESFLEGNQAALEAGFALA